jgi:acetylornithine deacetylase
VVKRQPTGQISSATAARDAQRLIAPLRREIIALLQKLVRTNSVAIPPDGQEAPAQKILARHLKRHGLDVELYDTGFLLKSRHPNVRRDRHYRGRPNLIARLPGTGGGKSLLFNGHIDTVPQGPNPWADSPWSGKIRAGRLYGRGAWDMKSGLVAQFAVLMALAKAGVKLRGDLLAESVVDEEWAGGGGTLAARLHGDTADAAVIGEGTNLSVVRATRGGYFFDLIARAGDASAYFSKQEVVSPAIPMGRILGWLDGWTRKRRQIARGSAYADFPDPAPVQILAVEANRFDPTIPLSTPLEARVRVYFQFLPHENVPQIVRELRQSFATFCRQDPFFRRYPPEWRPYVDPPLLGHELAANHPWTQCLVASAGAVLNRPVPVSAAEYPCDAFLLQREFGIPTLLFGPVGAGAHNADENVNIESVIHTAETLLTAALVWCS